MKTNLRNRLLLVVAMLAVSLGVGPAAAQNIPTLSPIPPALAGNRTLADWRARLDKERSEIRTQVQQHRTACANLVVGSAADAACARENGTLSGHIDAHIADSNKFNAALAKQTPTVRAMTRAECIKSAGSALSEELGKCRSPVIACLRREKAQQAAAECGAAGAASILSGLAAAGDPTKITVGMTVASLVQAMSTCRAQAGEAAAACEQDWGTCQDRPLQRWKADIVGCPAQ